MSCPQRAAFFIATLIVNPLGKRFYSIVNTGKYPEVPGLSLLRSDILHGYIEPKRRTILFITVFTQNFMLSAI